MLDDRLKQTMVSQLIATVTRSILFIVDSSRGGFELALRDREASEEQFGRLRERQAGVKSR
jgi:hypothetical protein